jgi:hypothetical protein
MTSAKSSIQDIMVALKIVVLITAIITGQSSFVELRAEHNFPTIYEYSDSTKYYADYSELLAIRIYTNTKWNTLDIIKDNQSLSLKPNSSTSLGAGFNYKSYGLAIAFGLPKSESSNRIYGKTNRLDLQMNMYKPKFGFDGFAQLYKGYYNSNPEEFINWENETFPQLPDMRVVSIGLNAFYIFNDEKFSYKAAFVRNQVQLKSAGSFTTGIFGHYDAAETDNGFIPTEFLDSIGNSFDLKAFSTLAIGVSVGYLYTWVISEHFFINVGVTPGFGNQRIELETINGQKSVKNTPAAQLTARSALGYDSRFFYMGITGVVTWRNFQYKGYDLDLATEQFKVFVGKRFDLRKKR